MINLIRATVTFAAAILLLELSGIAQYPTSFRARLSVMPIDFVNAAAVTGSGSATATLAGNTLTIMGTFEGLGGAAIFAKIHNGPRGIRGPAVWDIEVPKNTSGSFKGLLKLSAAQVEQVRQGRYYIQIHSAKAPEGNLWGWLLPEDQP